jgi:hypothetical protein
VPGLNDPTIGSFADCCACAASARLFQLIELHSVLAIAALHDIELAGISQRTG